ncbi:adhesion G-protein coupled receptor G7 [Pangasianodon hypophthalmus]|uniref:adhesion G-protein coupled receptor G7 n=1 Tax=Pangasianodon hypophthalmus TaxID=310915 RepID=UPI002307493F|nr:adhesion G-protein coupled receptor G7 [Pangasianodon hypophthalmus]
MAVSGNTTLPNTVPSNATNSSTATTTMVTNTMVTNATSTTLQCQHGGRETNGFCLCPDDFTGKFCELSGFPRATAWCRNETGTFDTPQMLNCGLTLNTIDNDLSNADPGARQKLAFNTQILTSKPDKLTTQNISTAAKIANSLLTNKDSSQDVHLAAVTTVSQLLNASMKQFYNVTADSITSLTQTLQKFSLTQRDEGSRLIQPNIAIQSIKVSRSSEIQMTVFSALNNGNQSNVPSGDSSDTLSANRIKINDTIIPSAQFPVDVQMNVKLKQGTTIGFVLYNNDQFFRSQVFQPSLNIKRRVITGYLGKENVLDFVQFTVRHQNVSSTRLYDFACVFWDYDKKDWSTKGCKKVWSSANRTCKCEGTTNLANFAMLMSFRSNPELIKALGMISLIGCALSVVGLTITMIFQILTRKLRKSSPTVLMVSICVCMIIVYLIFIFGIKNSTLSFSSVVSEENIIPLSDFRQDPDYGPCTAVTVLLHYFLLAAFTWSTLYATHIFLLIKNTISGPPQYFSVLSIVVGWGLPAVVVGISLGITYRINNPLNYRQEALCWLAAVDQNNRFDGMKPMLWGFLLPVAVMLLFNIVVLFYFSYATCKTNPELNSSQVTPLRSKMLGCVSMAVVLGLSWVIGYFMLLETNPNMQTILSYAFCLCNTTQGIQIFVLFTLRTPVFKQKALAVLKLIPAPVLARHKKTFDLWATEEVGPEQSYRSNNFDLYNL